MDSKDPLEYLKKSNPLRITVSGDIGAGKSTFSKRLAQELGIPRIYAGGLMREEATKLNVTLDELSNAWEKNDTGDKELDALVKARSEMLARGVFEGRLAWHFVKNPDVRVFISVDPEIAAKRIWNDSSNPLRDKYKSIDALKKANLERKKSETARYKNYYGLDAYDASNFDVIIDSGNLSIEQVFEEAVTKIAEFMQGLD
ncbi:MAG: cytidylate kinase family protein [Candidatus Uhrbacteria bacterium]|nr:cytidylate kinase family protein [Candidatus Uhrbacteria bacterium]